MTIGGAGTKVDDVGGNRVGCTWLKLSIKTTRPCTWMV